MKQVIFFRRSAVLLSFFLFGNMALWGQTPLDGASFVSPGNNSCHAGQIIDGSGRIAFPVSSGLTFSQLNYLETDFMGSEGYIDIYFFVLIQAACGQIEIRIKNITPWVQGVWVSSYNVVIPDSEGSLTGCIPDQNMLIADIKASYGSSLVTSIEVRSDFPGVVLFDNMIINNRIYNYDDCDGDGLLDLFDCAPQNNGNNKVLVCHEGHTICVAQSALTAHLGHGDYMGSCATNTRPANIIPEEISINELKLHPNPVTNQINIRNNNNKPLGTVSIYDISGKMIYRNFIGSSQAIIDVKNFSSGVYYLRSDQFEKPIKFVKQ